jgi:GT2 family glycosyltransferase
MTRKAIATDHAQMAETAEGVTVVVPVYGKGPNLRAVVIALRQQVPPIAKIIVSHSGPHDPTDVLSDFTDVTVLHSDQRLFAGAARNKGLRLAKTEWMAFVDEDVIADPGWHKALLGAISEGWTNIQGSIGVAARGGYWGMARWFANFHNIAPYTPARRIGVGGSLNMAVRRDILLSIGGFPEDWRMAQDVVTHYKLAAAGHELRFEPSVVARHVNLPGIRHMTRHLYHQGRFAAKFRRTYPAKTLGSLAVRFPPVSLVLGVGRFAEICLRILSSRGAPRASFILHLPGLIVGLTAWNIGFVVEAFRLPSRNSEY